MMPSLIAQIDLGMSGKKFPGLSREAELCMPKRGPERDE